MHPILEMNLSTPQLFTAPFADAALDYHDLNLVTTVMLLGLHASPWQPRGWRAHPDTVMRLASSAGLFLPAPTEGVLLGYPLLLDPDLPFNTLVLMGASSDA